MLLCGHVLSLLKHTTLLPVGPVLLQPTTLTAQLARPARPPRDRSPTAPPSLPSAPSQTKRHCPSAERSRDPDGRHYSPCLHKERSRDLEDPRPLSRPVQPHKHGHVTSTNHSGATARPADASTTTRHNDATAKRPTYGLSHRTPRACPRPPTRLCPALQLEYSPYVTMNFLVTAL